MLCKNMHCMITCVITLFTVCIFNYPHYSFHHFKTNCMHTVFCFFCRIFSYVAVFFHCLPLACNVLYINSVDMESLTGPQAIAKAISQTLSTNPLPAATTVHFKVSTQGITLTDSQRKWVSTFRSNSNINNGLNKGLLYLLYILVW